MHIVITNMFFGYRLMTIDNHGNPLDFQHIYKNKDIEKKMQVSPYLHRIYLLRVVDYLKAMDVFVVRMPDGRDGFIRNKGSQPLIVNQQTIHIAEKLQIGQRIIGYCISHDVGRNKKPLISSEIRLEMCGIEMCIGGDAAKKKPNSQLSQTEFYKRIINIFVDVTDNNTPLPFHISKKKDTFTITQQVENYCINHIHSIVQAIRNAHTTKKSVTLTPNITEEIDNTLAQAVLNLAYHYPDKDLSVIHVDNHDIAQRIYKTLNYADSELTDKLTIKSKQICYDEQLIEAIYESLFTTKITLNSGVTIHIEYTQLGHIIDIDLGYMISANLPKEHTLYRANYEAIQCIFKHMKWRNLHGIICIDLINMSAKNTRSLYRYILELAKQDDARIDVLPPSRFQIIELTRQFKNPPLKTHAYEVQNMFTLDSVLRKFQKELQEHKLQNKKQLMLSPQLYKTYIEFRPFIESEIKKSCYVNFSIHQQETQMISDSELEHAYTII